MCILSAPCMFYYQPQEYLIPGRCVVYIACRNCTFRLQALMDAINGRIVLIRFLVLLQIPNKDPSWSNPRPSFVKPSSHPTHHLLYASERHEALTKPKRQSKGSNLPIRRPMARAAIVALFLHVHGTPQVIKSGRAGFSHSLFYLVWLECMNSSSNVA